MPPSPSPVEHVVIIVKENHGFDTYFGKFPGAEGDSTLAPAANPPPVDPKHDHAAWLNRATGAVREQYAESDIPDYWAYARQYTLCDHYFTDVAGPSTPNHVMLIAGDSPWVDNPHGGYRAGAQNRVDIPSLPPLLEAKGLTWGNYNGYAFDFVKALAGKNSYPAEQFATDAKAGKLPSVSWVYADHPLSEHPADSPGELTSGVGNVTDGMKWTVDQVNAVVAGGLWPKVVVFITWDDWGGWADHVDPPEVEQWKDGTQFRYGNRVPCLVVSPFAKPGYISKAQHSHVSIVRFCEQNFGLPSVNARTAAADGMEDCFDFSTVQPPPGASAPPPPLPPQPPPTQPTTAGTSGTPAHLLRSIGEAADKAKARIEAARQSTTDANVLQQLRYAEMDVDRIKKLAEPDS